MRRQAIIALSAAFVAVSLTGQNAEARQPCIDRQICVATCPGNPASFCEIYRPWYCVTANAGCNDPGFGCTGSEALQVWCDFENM